MKQVWILERFETKEANLKTLKDLEDTLEWVKANKEPKEVKVWKDIVKKYKKKMDDNPDGYWLGIEGKRIYNQFCYVAKDYMRRRRDNNEQWRVVKAEIEDDAKYWSDYKNPVVNEGVMRYLWATL